MSTALQLAPPTGTLPVTEAVTRVHAVLDTVDAGPVGSVTGRDVADVDRAIARLEALKLRLVAAADRQDAGLPLGDGWHRRLARRPHEVVGWQGGG